MTDHDFPLYLASGANLSDKLGAQVEEASTGRVGDALGAITRRIREDNLMPGDRLPSEAALSRELGVARSVVREAFRSLAAMRIIELGAGRRATVAALDQGQGGPQGPMSLIIEHGVLTQQISVQQIYDVRRTIEARVAALAAIRRPDAEAAEVVALAAAMRAALGDPDALMEADLAFHAGLARACRNPVFALIVGAFAGITRQTWPIGWRSRTTAESREAMVTGHEAIAAAVAAGDPVRAAAAMEAHFDASVRTLLAAGLS